MTSTLSAYFRFGSEVSSAFENDLMQRVFDFGLNEDSEFTVISVSLGSTKEYNFKTLEQIVSSEMDKENITRVISKAPECNLGFSLSKGFVKAVTLKTKDRYLLRSIGVLISDFVVYGYINSQKISSLNLFSQTDSWVNVLGYLPPFLKLTEGTLGKLDSIDLESSPWHDHRFNKLSLWFGSCWQMYFAPIYYKYIPKPLWDDYTDCEENVVLENGLRKIKLYDNPDEFDSEESIRRHWAFRHQLGIDSIAHEIINPEWKVDNSWPVHITKINCEHGGDTRVTRYLNKKGELVPSDQATTIEIKEYLEDGITVVYEEIVNKKRLFGFL